MAWKISIDVLVVAAALLAAMAFKPINDYAVRMSQRFGSWTLRLFAEKPKVARPID